MGLPGTDLKLGQIIKKVKFKTFEFCPRFKSVLGYPSFYTTQNTKKSFLIC